MYDVCTYRVRLTVVTSPRVKSGLASSLAFSSARYASSLLMTLWAFSPAVFSTNLEPCPGLPGQVIFSQKQFLSP